jgi:hypothetical protein
VVNFREENLLFASCSGITRSFVALLKYLALRGVV